LVSACQFNVAEKLHPKKALTLLGDLGAHFGKGILSHVIHHFCCDATTGKASQ